MSMDSNGSDRKTGKFAGWWNRRGPLTRAAIIVLGVIIWSAAAYSYGYDKGLDGAIEYEKDSFQVNVVNYTIQKGQDGLYEIQGVIQNNYDKPILLNPSLEVKGFDSSGEMVLYVPAFITVSGEIRPGEKVKFRGEGPILDGHDPDDIIIGIKTECSGYGWA
ncbi:hypothetical protein ISG34_03655 [Methanothermobacter marburgensis]|uniref:Uncharacterized protein n=1 Tax=Methanothermobacter marburgensis (strain ATCC BAA-927 / DSM 2133 / JCM 14651 / NBRC 100331 / OCM 82 / Marburg) TaxID=79929 RepID=D9PVT3_METTM|nr:hypothetical protein [Methanothermobacter marburgensis]ADL58331.1 conserved hypothetical protein [Methanothermobacter marburgensis str. Marburg]WBF10483.1 hypothetical protein ISG34_03655 [Methanothermobacter marburgensis]